MGRSLAQLKQDIKRLEASEEKIKLQKKIAELKRSPGKRFVRKSVIGGGKATFRFFDALTAPRKKR